MSAILTDKPKSSTDNPLGIVLPGKVQRREDDPPSPSHNGTDKTKETGYVSARDATAAKRCDVTQHSQLCHSMANISVTDISRMFLLALTVSYIATFKNCLP